MAAVRVIVIGAGLVGTSIAADLDDRHEVVVIERDPDRVERLTYSLDVLAVQGDGTALSTLEEAGIDRADMVIASTDVDETNIVACATVTAISDAFTVARVKNTEYLRTWQRSNTAFGVEFMVCTNLLTAEAVVRVVGLPAARDVDRFADGTIEMAELEVPPASPLADRTVREADRFSALTFAAIFRNGDVTIPRGDTVIRGEDRVLVIGSTGGVAEFAGAVSPAERGGDAEQVVIVGGSEVGYHVARLLEERGSRSRLIERDPDRARDLAERLPDTVVMENDATDLDFLEREHVGDADLLVAALDSDEKNLLVCLLAGQLGVERTLAVVDDTEYVDLFETVGVDVSVSPRELVAEEITRFTRDGGAENVALIESGQAEVLEVEIDAESALVGRPIREAVADLPDDLVVGAITRGDDYVVPRGDTVVEAGDHVVLFVGSETAETVTARL